MKKLFLLIFFLAAFFTLDVFAQGAYIPFNRDYYHILERYEILDGNNNPSFHTGFKPYRRDHVGAFLDSLSEADISRSKADRDTGENCWINSRVRFGLAIKTTKFIASLITKINSAMQTEQKIKPHLMLQSTA